MEIVVLTTTYNRAEQLNILKNSLENQKCKDFLWIIVDDGSKDETETIVNNWKEDRFKRIYIKKENGGKSRALNYGFDYLYKSGHINSFVIIIDDDEILYEDAINNVKTYADKYRATSCVAMEFLRNDYNGNPISNYPIKDDFFMTVWERKSKGLEIDGYVGYYLEKLDGERFPEYEGEKYVGPGVLQMLVDGEDKILWPKTAIGKTEYREDGITKQGRKLRLKNPKGMIMYCLLLQNEMASFKIRYKYSIMGYAYYFFSHISLKELSRERIEINKFKSLALVPGMLLAKIWKIKYKSLLK